MRSASILASLPLALAAPSKRGVPAPLMKPRHGDIIEGKYIVKMKSSSTIQILETHKNMVASNVDYTYNSAKFSGFAGTMTAEEVEALQDMPDVSGQQTNLRAIDTLSANIFGKGRVYRARRRCQGIRQPD